jgi:cyclopropane fatty-acyl-phospholipid synthase-like methyltransferase
VPDSIDRPASRGPYYAEGTRVLGRAFAQVAASLAEQLRAVATIADVGAGSGVWSLAMAAGTDARVVAVDLPDVIDNVGATAARLGLSDRVTMLVGDYFEAVLESPVDRVVLANVLHLERERDAARLVRHWARQLAPDGELVIIDVFAPADPHDELAAAAYALHLGMRTRRGAAHPESRLRAWCRDAGLGSQQLLRLGVVSISALVCRSAGRVFTGA